MANITGSGNIQGTSSADIITGSNGADQIFGLGGDDLLAGLDGNDELHGGTGRDDHYGGNGTDTVYFDHSSSFWVVNLANRTAVADGLTETVDSIENVVMGSGGSQVTGDGGRNVLTGGSGADWLKGGAGNDDIVGGGDNDTAAFSFNYANYSIVQSGDDFFVSNGSEGTDRVYSDVEFFAFADVVKSRTQIIADITKPTVSILGTPTVDEGGTLSFTVTRNGGNSSQPLTVFYSTGGQATSSSDYTAPPGSVTINAGSSTGQINISTINDGVDEPNDNESLTLTLSSSANYNLGTSTATGTIRDVTAPPSNSAPTVTSAQTTGSVVELADNALGENTTSHTRTGAINFADTNLSDSHTVTATALASGYRGSLTPMVTNSAAGDGSGVVTWTYRVNDSALDSLTAGQTVTETFAVTIRDNNGGEVSRNVAITLTGASDVSLKSAQTIFNEFGELNFFARLAKAAYQVSSLETPIPDNDAVGYYTFVSSQLQLLRPSDFPPNVRDVLVTTGGTGLVDGIYTSANAATLIARSSDAVFISFRGTEDSADRADWFDLDGHYDKFIAFRVAINQYISDNNITQVYVTGHSLGASMAQAFMEEHPSNGQFAGVTFEAVTFANPGYGFSGPSNVGRIVNVWTDSDPIRLPASLQNVIGDGNIIHDNVSLLEGISVPHSMSLYLEHASLLRESGIDVDELLNLASFDFDSYVMNARVLDNGRQFDAGVDADTLLGTTDRDIVVGGAADDNLNGGYNAFTLLGDGAADRLYGGTENDTYHFYRNSGTDTIFDISGDDTIYYHGNAFPGLISRDEGESDLIGGLTGPRQTGNNLVLAFLGGTNITIEHYFSASGSGFGAGRVEYFIDGNEGFFNWPDTRYYFTVSGDLTGRAGEQSYVAALAGSTASNRLDDGDSTVAVAAQIFVRTADESLPMALLASASESDDPFDDWLFGADGQDTVIAHDGDDVVFGGAQNDQLAGGEGDDFLDGGTGADSLDGGPDNTSSGGLGDTALYVFAQSGVSVSLASGSGTRGDAAGDTLTAIENLVGSEFADDLVGNAGTNLLLGLGGDDHLDGGGGPDGLAGGPGNDTYYVDNIGDVVTENANQGADTVHSSASFTLGANVENLVLQGSANLQGYGNTLGNSLTGNSGNNLLDGLGGADAMAGGTGNDAYFVDHPGDTQTENANEGTDTVYSTAHLRIGANIENLVMQGSADLQGYGNAVSNAIYGNSGGNLLDGDAGADAMYGGTGADNYFVDNAGDTIVENANEGIDTVYSSAHLGLTANLENLLLQGSADLQGFGNSLSNAIYGNTGSNLLDGGADADSMYGGVGNDTYYVDNIADVVVENANEGFDTIYSTASLVAATNVETLLLQGSGDLQGYGNALSNAIYGNSGANLLDGGVGGDSMYGGLGNDVYYVDNIADVLVENLNEGIDTVFSTASLVLAANVEQLVLQGSADLQAYGNGLSNALFGNSGNNIIDGRGGADGLTGNAGNDTFFFAAGEANGDSIADFAGNGAAAGDALLFSGYGAGATFTNIDATHWQVNYNGGVNHDIITFANAASIHASDFAFV